MKKMGRWVALFLAFLLAIGGLSQVAFVSAASDKDEEVKVTRVVITNKISELRVGRTVNLKASVRPRDAYNDEIYWYSSNPEVAEVDEYGEVRARKPGYTTITAEADNGKSESFELVVPGGKIRANAQDRFGVDVDPNAKKTEKTESSSKPSKTKATDIKDLSASKAIEAVKKANKKASVVFTNVDSVSAKTLQSVANAFKTPSKLHFDTKPEKSIQGRLTIDPAKAAELTGSILPGVYTSESKTKTITKRFKKFFYNDIAVIRCEQEGSFGMPVSIAAKVDLTGLKETKMKVYSYNPTTNKYDEISDAGCWVDKNGFLHLNTTVGDYLIVSNGALVRR